MEQETTRSCVISDLRGLSACITVSAKKTVQTYSKLWMWFQHGSCKDAFAWCWFWYIHIADHRTVPGLLYPDLPAYDAYLITRICLWGLWWLNSLSVVVNQLVFFSHRQYTLVYAAFYLPVCLKVNAVVTWWMEGSLMTVLSISFFHSLASLSLPVCSPLFASIAPTLTLPYGFSVCLSPLPPSSLHCWPANADNCFIFAMGGFGQSLQKEHVERSMHLVLLCVSNLCWRNVKKRRRKDSVHGCLQVCSNDLMIDNRIYHGISAGWNGCDSADWWTKQQPPPPSAVYSKYSMI